VQVHGAARAFERNAAIRRGQGPGDDHALNRKDLRQRPRCDQQARGADRTRQDRQAPLASRALGRQHRHGAREQQRHGQADHHLMVDLPELRVHVMRRHQRQQQPGHAAGEQREVPPADLTDHHHRGGTEQRR
jgi:hypothetical protein